MLKEKNLSPDVFFLRLDYESSSKVFQSYQINSVPIIFHTPPRLSDNNQSSDSQISPRERYAIPSIPDAEGLANFLREKTSHSVTIKRSMWGVYLFMLVLFGGMLALVQPVINSLPRILKLIQWKPLWLLVSAGVYTCAISGLIFDIIRNPPMYHANPGSGQILFFNPQSSQQFVVEGFIIGFLNLGCAGALIALAAFVTQFKSQQYKDYGTIAAVVVFALCFIQIRGLYVMKNRWYGYA